MESVWQARHPASLTPSGTFVAGARVDTIVAGAGLTGLVTALLLAEAGQRVVVLEARRTGAVTTGRTTAKVSLLQGLTLSGVHANHSLRVLKAYVAGIRAGQEWLVAFMDARQIPYERRDAFTFVTTDRGARKLRREFTASRQAGLDVEWTTTTELPFPVAGALRLPDQVQIDPFLVLDALRARLAELGGQVVEGARLLNAVGHDPVTVVTSQGELLADRLVLATGIPVLDRGLYFAKVRPQRDFVATYRVHDPRARIPQGMYVGVDEPDISLRTLTVDGEQCLMVGGGGYVTGRRPSPAQLLADLERWTLSYYPTAQRTYAWSAQDYESVNHVPFVGLMPRGRGAIYLATGYQQWGMTNAVAAGLRLRGQILGDSTEWATTLSHRVTKPLGFLRGLAFNAEVAAGLLGGWVTALAHRLPTEPPAEGRGQVGRGRWGLPEARSTVGGRTCAVSGICSHMGGVLRWNDAERSWDCPLHGSRFAPDGARLEGPTRRDQAAP